MGRVFPEKSCGCVILRDENGVRNVLIVQSASHFHWSFPKGHMEEGETEEETACREVMEETGIAVSLSGATRYAFRHTMHYQTRRGNDKEVVYFLALADAYEVVLQREEICDHLWVPLHETEGALTFARDQEVVRHVIQYLDEQYE